MQILENIPLAPLTTLGVGGPARYFAEAASVEDVLDALTFAKIRGQRVFVLGGGSNLVVADSGFPGLVLQIAIRGITCKSLGQDYGQDQPHTRQFTVSAGEPWDDIVAYTVAQNCAGVECLSGIPGTTGGTPVQNVGAYGQEVSQSITTVEAVEIASGHLRTFTNADCRFGYRTSLFNTAERGRWIILRTTFSLHPNGPPKLAYGDLQNYFCEHGETPSLQQVRDAVRGIRHSKAMLIVAGDENSQSAGSFFQNPILDDPAYQAMQMRARERGLAVPSYPSAGENGNHQHKVPAAWLVEHSGFCKGFALGHAGISSKHALAIVNRGGATAAEIIALKDEIQRRVAQLWSVELQSEPVLLGF